MKRIYFYRGEAIIFFKNGWMRDGGDLNIYATINDAKNAIDKTNGGYGRLRGGVIPNRRDKPIRIVGQFAEEDAKEV